MREGVALTHELSYTAKPRLFESMVAWLIKISRLEPWPLLMHESTNSVLSSWNNTEEKSPVVKDDAAVPSDNVCRSNVHAA